jgi:hypothetical protein
MDLQELQQVMLVTNHLEILPSNSQGGTLNNNI